MEIQCITKFFALSKCRKARKKVVMTKKLVVLTKNGNSRISRQTLDMYDFSIVPRFIVRDNIMLKINVLKKCHRKFLVNLRVEIREFPFFYIFGGTKTAQKTW